MLLFDLHFWFFIVYVWKLSRVVYKTALENRHLSRVCHNKQSGRTFGGGYCFQLHGFYAEDSVIKYNNNNNNVY